MMDIMKLIPSPDVAPLPSPSWVFIFFYMFTFLLHIIFVNFTLGGSILLFISRYLSRRWNKPDYDTVAEEIGWVNTFNISFTITTGVAPLLFLQVVYGQFFYSSSILLGWKWLMVLVAICLGYYGYYLYKFKPGYIRNSSSRGFYYVAFSAVMFIFVAVMLVGNTLLSSQPEIWKAVYSGERSFISADTFLPRVLHFIIASVAVSGVFLMLYGRYKSGYSETLRREMVNFGRNSFILSTMIQIPVGLIFLFSHRRELYMLFFGGSGVGTASLWLGVLTAVAALYFAYKRPEKVWNLAGLLLVSVVLMTIARRVVENGYFSKYFDYTTLKIAPQWDMFSIFTILLIGLVVTIFVMLRKVYSERKV